MTVKLKNLDKVIEKLKRKLIKALVSSTTLNEMGDKITDDIKIAHSLGKMPDLADGEVVATTTKLKKAPKLTKKTIKEYERRGIPAQPDFRATGELRSSIQPRIRGNRIYIESNTTSGRNKLKWLKKSNKRNGKPKKTRIALGWTKARTNILKGIIRSAIKRKFK